MWPGRRTRALGEMRIWASLILFSGLEDKAITCLRSLNAFSATR